MKKLLLTFICMLIPTVATSQALYTPYPPGGTSLATLTLLKEELDKKGYNIDFKSLGNCALVKQSWDNTKDKLIILWDDDLNSKRNVSCNINFKEDEFVRVFYQAHLYFCAVPGVDPNKWRTKGSNYTVGLGGALPIVSLLQYLDSKNGTTGKHVTYRNSTSLATAITAKEIDYVLAHSGITKLINEGGNCIWTTASSTNSINNIPNIKTIYPDTQFGDLSFSMWLLAKNFSNEEMNKLRSDVVEFMKNNDQFKKFLAGRDAPNPVEQSEKDVNDRLIYMRSINDMP